MAPVGANGEGPLPQPREVGAHAYAWIGPYGPPTAENHGFRMNLGFVVGNEAVAVIDSGYGPRTAEAMIRQIRQITDQRIRYVINTNSQPHRIRGTDTADRKRARLAKLRGQLFDVIERYCRALSVHPPPKNSVYP